jgi:hypothetical protein
MEVIADIRRREIKFSIPQVVAFQLQQRLRLVLPPDKNNRGSEGYIVRSLYFDSFDDKDFHNKIAGVEAHKKIRLRNYPPGSTSAKLELKVKTGVWQRKRSITLNRQDAEAIISGDFSPLLRTGQPLGEQLYYAMTGDIYRPKCVVQYRRVAFMLPTNDIRITLDSRIEASEANWDLFSDKIPFYPVSRSDVVILEVKYDHFLLDFVKEMLSMVDKSPVSYSKYIMGRRYSYNEEY